MATHLVALPEIERLSPRVIRVLGGNPSKFTLQGTNTYLVGSGPRRILIDSGEGKRSWATALSKILEAEQATIETCLLTHWHHDHIDGVADVVAAAPLARICKHMPSLKGDAKWIDITNGERFTTDGATLRAVHCPGHTKDHMAFVLEEEDAMFTGDNVLGHGTAVFEDLAAYMASLELISGEFTGRAYPGHGAVIEDGRSRTLEYIAHRKEREKQILDVLGREHEGGWVSMEVVKVVYRDVPENLHMPAERGVIQVLHKLRQDGRVAVDDERWRLAESSGKGTVGSAGGAAGGSSL